MSRPRHEPSRFLFREVPLVKFLEPEPLGKPPARREFVVYAKTEKLARRTFRRHFAVPVDGPPADSVFSVTELPPFVTERALV
jgi:hypothetical protein